MGKKNLFTIIQDVRAANNQPKFHAFRAMIPYIRSISKNYTSCERKRPCLLFIHTNLVSLNGCKKYIFHYPCRTSCLWMYCKYAYNHKGRSLRVLKT